MLHYLLLFTSWHSHGCWIPMLLVGRLVLCSPPKLAMARLRADWDLSAVRSFCGSAGIMSWAAAPKFKYFVIASVAWSVSASTLKPTGYAHVAKLMSPRLLLYYLPTRSRFRPLSFRSFRLRLDADSSEWSDFTGSDWTWTIVL